MNQQKAEIIHGQNCPKATHWNDDGYLHAETWDRPYDVDGVTYCGRCHAYMPPKAESVTVGDVWRCKQDGRAVRVVGLYDGRVAVRSVETNRLSVFRKEWSFRARYRQSEPTEVQRG